MKRCKGRLKKAECRFSAFFRRPFECFRSVFQQHRAPCEAAAYTFKQQVVAALDLPALNTGVQSQRDGGGYCRGC